MARRPIPWFWEARGAWFVTIGGVRHKLAATKKEAFERFYKLMREPKRRNVSRHSLVAIIDEFLEWVQKHLSAKNYVNYRYRLQRFIDRWPDLRPDELRPFHVEKWADSFEISRTTRRNYLRAVKRCMRWAKQQGYIDENPIADLVVPAGESREVVIRPAEFARLLSFIRNDAFRQLVLVAWETGCRPQEILKVTAAHVDLSNSRWVFQRSEAKMKRKARIIYLTDKAMDVVKRRMATNPQGPLFRNGHGNPWTAAAVNCQFQQIRIRMGMEEFTTSKLTPDATLVAARLSKLNRSKIVHGKTVIKSERELLGEAKRKARYRQAAQLAPRYSLYALRHSWATNALERGVDALTVAVLMGHSDPSTLARVYQHLSHNPQHLLEQARRAAAD